MINSKSLPPPGGAGSSALSDSTQPPHSRQQPIARHASAPPTPLACSVLKRHARLSYLSHFELLDVPENADGETIRRAFQQAVQRFHPDQLTGQYAPLQPLAKEIVCRIGAAYRVLENDATRQQYRTSLEQSTHLRAVRSSMPPARSSNPSFRASSLPGARPSSLAFRASSIPTGRASVPGPSPSRPDLPATASNAGLDMSGTGTPEKDFAAARIHLGRGAVDEAFTFIERACVAEPENAQYGALHAWLRVQRGELALGPVADEIVMTLTWAVRQRRHDLEIRMYRGRVLQRLGRRDEAIRDFSVVASMDETNLEAISEVRLHRAREEQKAAASGVRTRLFKKS